MSRNREFLKQPPVAVSPLIKTGRYAMLIAGIFYGISKERVYSVLAARHREKEEEIRILIEEELAKEKARKGRK